MRSLTAAVLALALIVLANLTPIYHLGNYGRAAYAVLLGLVLLTRSWDLLQLSVVLFFMSIYWFVVPDFLKGLPSVSFLLSFAVSLAFAWPKMTKPLAWFRSGRIDAFSRGFLVATGLLSTAALIAWAFWTDHLGAAVEMAQGLAGLSRPALLFIVVPLFGVINAFAEEIVYRGIVQEALSRTIAQPALVILLQASAFAAAHYAGGFPNGRMGYLMVLVYGSALGYLRYRTKGFFAPYIAHVLADLTIGYFLVFKFL